MKKKKNAREIWRELNHYPGRPWQLWETAGHCRGSALSQQVKLVLHQYRLPPAPTNSLFINFLTPLLLPAAALYTSTTALLSPHHLWKSLTNRLQTHPYQSTLFLMSNQHIPEKKCRCSQGKSQALVQSATRCSGSLPTHSVWTFRTWLSLDTVSVLWKNFCAVPVAKAAHS